MASGVLVIGESGAGKSTGIETLNPDETFLINVANKPLPFKGWKKKYSLYSKDSNPKGNMISTADPKSIADCMKYVSSQRPEIKILIVDDWQYMSGFEYMNRAAEKGYEKFTSISANLGRVATLPKDLREDLVIVFLTHAETSQDLEGNTRLKAKTVGRMIDSALTLEGLFSIVLFAKAKKTKDGIKYIFETKNDGSNTCKSPKGMFDTSDIPNDLKFVYDSIVKYEND